MWWRLLLAGLLATGTRGFAPAPLRWGGLPARTLILAPKTLPNTAVVSQGAMVLPQSLTIFDQSGRMSGEAPNFVARPDKTIAWADLNLCISANAGTNSGNLVSIDRCTGASNQLWSFTPWSHGRKTQIRLKDDPDKCLAVKDDDGLNGALVELRHCTETLAESWHFGEASSLQNLSQHSGPSSSMRGVAISFASVALLAALGLGIWLRLIHTKARQVSLTQNSLLLTSACHGGVPLTTPLAVPVAMRDETMLPLGFDIDVPDINLAQMVPEEQSLTVHQLIPSMLADGGGAVLERPAVMSGVITVAESPRPALKRQGDGGGSNGGHGGGGGGDGGGDGGGNSEQFLRTLKPAELKLVTDDWMARSRIYRMTGEFGNPDLAALHNSQLQLLESVCTLGPSDEYLMFALFKEAPELRYAPLEESDHAQKIRAVIGVHVAAPNKYVCHQLIAKPSLINNVQDKISAFLNMLSAILALSTSTGVDVYFSQLMADLIKAECAEEA